MEPPSVKAPRAIVGLGNPGTLFEQSRHNIGFTIIDQLAAKYAVTWTDRLGVLTTTITINGNQVVLIKPWLFMNNSGLISSILAEQKITVDQLLVIHDELEQPFGKITMRIGGSARGHNGLKSIMSTVGEQFGRLRVGIGRPAHKDEVPQYVLQKFTETSDQLTDLIAKCITLLENQYL